MKDLEYTDDYCDDYCPKCGSYAIVEDRECTQECEESGIDCDYPLYICTVCGNKF